MRDIIFNCVDKISLMQKEYFLNKIIDIAENSIWYLESKPIPSLIDKLNDIKDRSMIDLQAVIIEMKELGMDTTYTRNINKRFLKDEPK